MPDCKQIENSRKVTVAIYYGVKTSHEESASLEIR